MHAWSTLTAQRVQYTRDAWQSIGWICTWASLYDVCTPESAAWSPMQSSMIVTMRMCGSHASGGCCCCWLLSSCYTSMHACLSSHWIHHASSRAANWNAQSSSVFFLCTLAICILHLRVETRLRALVCSICTVSGVSETKRGRFNDCGASRVGPHALQRSSKQEGSGLRYMTKLASLLFHSDDWPLLQCSPARATFCSCKARAHRSCAYSLDFQES